ncbi:MAG: immune inhibitor A [Anaerolineae bacterium]|nr:immune inhibitor A [Anaerolineae bacterium]
MKTHLLFQSIRRRSNPGGILIGVLTVWACMCVQLPIVQTPVATVGPIEIVSPTPAITPTLNSEKESLYSPDIPVSSDTLDAIAAAESLPRDLYDLAQRFKGASDLPIDTVEPPTYDIDSLDTFWVHNDDTEKYHQVTAQLVYMTEHVAMWVEKDVYYDRDVLIAAANRFEEETYPTNHDYFGTEASPGIDGDVRLHILHSAQLGGGVMGYFYSPSQYPVSVFPYSNEREIFYISINALMWGEDYYSSVLAHEFQHMITWNIDRNEDGWLDEGQSELASFVNGYGPSDKVPMFFQNPNLQLNTWPEDGNSGPHYGASYLFVTYFLDRFGVEAVRTLAAEPANGLDAVDNVLKSMGLDTGADQYFGEWVIANWLQDPNVPPGIYGYTSEQNLYTPGIAQKFKEYPVPLTSLRVHQYGTDYINLHGPAQLTIQFEGMTQTRVVPANTADTDNDSSTPDSFVWWSNRGDQSNMTLTRPIDLTGVSDAQLEFDFWYWIEEGWDYGFVTVSTDGGQTWTIPEGLYTTNLNPRGNAYGPGYTGRSFDQPDANAEGWLHERIDLGAYAGNEILLRFEMITDDAVNQPGMVIDNICIAAIDFCDDVESGAGQWESQGFVRHNNILPQRFLVQLIVPADDGTVAVLPFPLDEANRGQVTIEVSDRAPATLVISGLTRYTTEVAEYQIEIDTLHDTP